MGFAYVAPIGMQNMYIINSSLNYSKKELLITVFLTIINDIILAMFCFLGIGQLITKSSFLSSYISYLGFIAIVIVSYNIWNTKPKATDSNTTIQKSKLVVTPFIIAWLNPQAILDGSIILGSMYSSFSTSFNRSLFIIGFSLSSIIWFSLLSIFVFFSKNLINDKTQNILNKASAIILLYFGLNLIIS
jgi:L-lysine exporter family protein LysE/ArgO